MSSPVSGRKQQAEERRAQILDAALSVFAEKGYDGASMRDIAREVGVTEGLLYHYFESKEALLHSCWAEHSWRAHLERILARADGKPLPDVLRSLAGDFLQSLRENAPMVRICAMQMQREGGLAADFVARIEEGQDRLTEFLRARQEAGEIRPGLDVRAVGGLLMGTAHSMFLLWGAADDQRWQELVHTFLTDCVGIVMNGITPNGRTACEAV